MNAVLSFLGSDPAGPLSAAKVRELCRSNQFRHQTSGHAPGCAQANLCILPKEYAYDFLLFCTRNPRPCPVLAVLEEGSRACPSRVDLASSLGTTTAHSDNDNNVVDVARDLPKYRIYKDGVLDREVDDCINLWQDDFVTFVIGCSFSFESALSKLDLPLRHVEEGKNVPMYNTNIPCNKAGIFQGCMVVSMRPMLPAQAIKAIEVTSRYPRVHGSPVHFGDPCQIGIKDINQPDYGEAVSIKEGEVPVFWACGVTPQAIVMASKPSLCITHAPGCMLVLDTKNEELAM